MRKIFISVVISFLTILSAFAQENRVYGPTKANEGLWSIASGMNQSSDISVSQIMLALLHKNPQAFFMQNINALEPGSIIICPSLAEINAISKNKAYLEVEKQNKAWQYIANKDSGSAITHKSSKTRKSKHYANKQHEDAQKIITASKSKAPTEQKSNPLLTKTPALDMVNVNAEIVKINSQIKSIMASMSKLIEKKSDPALTKTPTIDQATTNTEATKLNDQISIMQTQLDQINTRVNFVEKSTNKLLTFDITNIFKPLSKYTQADAVVASCVISSSALLLFIIISLLIQLLKKTPVFNFPKEEYGIATNKEEENIAKLNLARAYIDMGKNNEARVVINEVIAHGDPVERAEAQGLLAKIT